MVRGNVGLDDFSDAAVRDARVLALASKVRYRIDPQNPYPNNFTGHVRAVLADGGAREPLTRADIEAKFLLNARRGGVTAARAQETLAALRRLYAEPILDMKPLRGEFCR